MLFEKGMVDDFVAAASALGLTCGEITIDTQPAAHKPHPLPAGKCAVYIFALSTQGSDCPAGRGRVLKVGKAGPSSNARFQSQHYSAGSAPSTLAGMLLNGKILWPHLGITDLTDDSAGEWIKANTDRYNIYLPSSCDGALLGLLERYIRGRVGPVFEGG